MIISYFWEIFNRRSYKIEVDVFWDGDVGDFVKWLFGEVRK